MPNYMAQNAMLNGAGNGIRDMLDFQQGIRRTEVAERAVALDEQKFAEQQRITEEQELGRAYVGMMTRAAEENKSFIDVYKEDPATGSKALRSLFGKKAWDKRTGGADFEGLEDRGDGKLRLKLKTVDGSTRYMMNDHGEEVVFTPDQLQRIMRSKAAAQGYVAYNEQMKQLSAAQKAEVQGQLGEQITNLIKEVSSLGVHPGVAQDMLTGEEADPVRLSNLYGEVSDEDQKIENLPPPAAGAPTGPSAEEEQAKYAAARSVLREAEAALTAEERRIVSNPGQSWPDSKLTPEQKQARAARLKRYQEAQAAVSAATPNVAKATGASLRNVYDHVSGVAETITGGVKAAQEKIGGAAVNTIATLADGVSPGAGAKFKESLGTFRERADKLLNGEAPIRASQLARDPNPAKAEKPEEVVAQAEAIGKNYKGRPEVAQKQLLKEVEKIRVKMQESRKLSQDARTRAATIYANNMAISGQSVDPQVVGNIMRNGTMDAADLMVMEAEARRSSAGATDRATSQKVREAHRDDIAEIYTAFAKGVANKDDPEGRRFGGHEGVLTNFRIAYYKNLAALVDRGYQPRMEDNTPTQAAQIMQSYLRAVGAHGKGYGSTIFGIGEDKLDTIWKMDMGVASGKSVKSTDPNYSPDDFVPKP